MTTKTFADLGARGAIADTDDWAVYPAGGPLQRVTSLGVQTYLNASYLRLDGTAVMTAPLPLADGTVNAPSLTFGTSPTTGFWTPASGQWALSAGGIKVLSASATAVTAGQKLLLPAGTTNAASMNVAPGVAPTSPSNGDIWATAASLCARIGGFTKDIADISVQAWTPTVTFATPGNLSVAYSTQSASLIKITSSAGTLCIATFNIITSTFTFSTASGAFEIHGLPVAPSASLQSQASGQLAINWSGFTGLVFPPAVITPGSSILNLNKGANAWAAVDTTNFTTGNNITLHGNFTYRSA